MSAEYMCKRQGIQQELSINHLLMDFGCRQVKRPWVKWKKPKELAKMQSVI